jgi:hypothetical protein
MPKTTTTAHTAPAGTVWATTRDRYATAEDAPAAVARLAELVQEIGMDPGRLPGGQADALLAMVPELRRIWQLATHEHRTGTDAPTWPDKLGEWGHQVALVARIVWPEVRDLIQVWDHRV